ncbi:MAG: carboxypeptidase-like regulatory domain-containing protein [Acidobacteriaceae bacterium]
MNRLLLISVLGSSGLLFSQTICPGTAEQCREAQTRLCADERAPANLELSDSRSVEGTVAEQSGAKFETGVAVQLRSPKSGAILQSASVENGEFRFGQVPTGSYRLIVVKTTPSGPERLKMFDQPKSLVCQATGPICKLLMMPTIHGTDNPIDYCPPK